MPPLDTGNALTGDGFHYPPDVLELLVEAMPRLVKSKKALVDFFRGCGVPAEITADVSHAVETDSSSITKFKIARVILRRLNERGDPMLGPRREVIRRVADFDAFSQCWPNDQAPARGLVAQLRELVGQKDAFTRMERERDREAAERRKSMREAIEAKQRKRAEVAAVRDDLASLFAESDRRRRGERFQDVLNKLFEVNDVAVRDAFVRVGTGGEGIVEQIDGAIGLDAHVYLVEAKWWTDPIGVVEMRDFLSKVHGRADGRGVYISATGYTKPAVAACREALDSRIVVLSTLEEILTVLESGGDLTLFLQQKVRAAQLDKNPFATVSLDT